jgi:excisionase family DNA binding protein
MRTATGIRTVTVAERLGVDLREVYRLVERGELELVRPVDGAPLITEVSLARYMAQRSS